jgi:hypothetical protein
MTKKIVTTKGDVALPSDWYCLPCQHVRLLRNDQSVCLQGVRKRPAYIGDCAKYFPMKDVK